jgi:predicted nuclease with RNAse H fold
MAERDARSFARFPSCSRDQRSSDGRSMIAAAGTGPALLMGRPLWGGIDVGGRRKGFHGAVVDDDALVALAHLETAADVVAWVGTRSPELVAIDAPIASAPDGGRSRACERELVAAKVCGIRYTPDRQGLDSNPVYYEWIEHGLELYAACRAAGIEAIECFPTASWSRWAGSRGASRRSEWTRRALDSADLEGLPSRLNQDQRDAIGAALTARAHTRGLTERFGDIVVPLAGR